MQLISLKQKISPQNGTKFEGQFKEGKRNGQGTYTYPDGRKYEGDWKDDKPWNGQEVYTSPIGMKYVGGFKDGKKHGQGTYTRHD